MGEPLAVLDDGIEFVTVNDQQAPAVRGGVDGVFLDGNRTVFAVETGEKFVVVSGDIDHARAFSSCAQEFLDDVVVGLGPVDAPPQGPDINEVADHVQRFKLVGAEEFE